MTLLPFRTGPTGTPVYLPASTTGQSRLDRLRRLHLLAVAHEMSAEPCTPERARRGVRADRVARALREEQARVGWEA